MSAGGKAELHGQCQEKREDLLEGKHGGTFFHNDDSSGMPWTEVSIGWGA